MAISPNGNYGFSPSVGKALAHSRQGLENVLAKSQFWQAAGHIILTERQRKVVSRMLEGFEGGMTTRKYKGLAHTSPATAQRELADLLKKGLLLQTPGTAGRNVSYQVNWELSRMEKV